LEQPNVGSAPDYATTNAFHLPATAHIRELRDAAKAACASYGYRHFAKVVTRKRPGFLPVELDGLGQSDTERFFQLLARHFLAIYPGNLLDPPDPPIAFLLYYRGVCLLHNPIYLPAALTQS
jgi:hypothetical protein